MRRPGPGRPVTGFAADRARRVSETDRWLASLLGGEASVALVAAGGYGRRELLPGSDLDLVLLHDGRPDICVLADRIWYPVWDSGIRLDHAVRSPDEARAAARADLRVALGLLPARHVAGDAGLTTRLRLGVLADWRAAASTRLAELQAMHRERTERSGELAFLLEPDLKEARGGLRDLDAISAIAAAWVAPAPGPRVRAAHGLLLDARHALHEVTGRAMDRLVLQEQDQVARLLELLDADALLHALAGAGRTVAYALDQSFRQAQRSQAGGQAASRVRITLPGVTLTRRRPPPVSPRRRPLAEGLVEQDGEVVLARSADPATDPVLVLRAAAAAALAGLVLSPRTLARLAGCPPLPVPWPAEARDCLTALLGAGPSAIAVWEALDQEELITRLLPDWERVRNHPQRNPLHTFTVDRHLVETAAHAAALTRTVARPDLLLVSALLHDIGKGWPGDHQLTGEVMARDTAHRLGFSPADADLVASAVRYHLLLPQAATRRDLDDPMTVAAVAKVVTSRPLLALLHALAIADARATGPAAWNGWKAGLIKELVARVAAALGGERPPEPLPLRPEQIELAAAGEPAAIVCGSEVTVTAPDRPGLLWQAAGVLASHRLAVRSANATTCGEMAVTAFTVAPQFGEPPDAMLVTSDLRRALAGQLDVAQRLAGRTAAARALVPVAPPQVRLVDDASDAATVVEVRAHDAPGLLWQIGRALGECGLDVRAARVETLGAEAVDVFYVVDACGRPVTDAGTRGRIATAILSALAG
jgi:[protein-PII] uridylyltransferase